MYQVIERFYYFPLKYTLSTNIDVYEAQHQTELFVRVSKVAQERLSHPRQQGQRGSAKVASPK